MRDVSDEYDFLTVEDTITSVGSTSFEWMNNTFDVRHREEIKETSYITGNGYTEPVLEHGGETGHAAMPFGPSEYEVVTPEDFGHLEELWRADFDETSEWMIDGDVGSRINPEYTTDRAIKAGREQPTEQLVVHYMYPHDPFPLADRAELFRPFDSLRSGDISREEAYSEYLDHLRLVLDEVERLLDNLDAEKVVITADHGEAFGEFGFYRHVIGCPLPCIREVPWVITDAEDQKTCASVAPNPESGTESISVEARLEDLGYL
ncbi:arylsulfatase A-like enzyme [Halolamina salifodinae]|uniref:Arylsulfatase A-like enzyme n=1 Tax=Halolamina salifodinae TaxID=1202767 RepID=A0A8T4GRD1_9EURY|nr:arylsulfatase A-like enzyme [Halolamina salifodinae]